jgi:hypothetical protein
MFVSPTVSSPNSLRIISRSSRWRSRASNGLHRLAGVSGKSAAGRRFRDLTEAFSADLGILSEHERLWVRTAATLTLRVETLQSRIACGEEVDDEQMVRVLNAQQRALRSLDDIKRRRDDARAKPTLAGYLAVGASAE